ncbi:GGDEF domain-containing protein [Acholeplasma laidlawii]|uniref:GGDEF domain-containing protein n=1 Tax=Acholeplasma laidlawii TaxID=2148 RepID=UPI0022A9354E|nr:diguanylate cyclase [Acholeplasma laidlawii]
MFVQNNKVRYDHLTGIFNRRHMDYYLDDKLIRAKRGKLFSAILFDLDDFKDINDKFKLSISHGHYVYQTNLDLTRDQFIDVVDRNMYDNKINKKKSSI